MSAPMHPRALAQAECVLMGYFMRPVDRGASAPCLFRLAVIGIGPKGAWGSGTAVAVPKIWTGAVEAQCLEHSALMHPLTIVG